MAQEKIIISTDASGEWTARVYDGTMRVFLQQHIKSKRAAWAAVRKFQREQQEMIENGELIELL